VPITITLLEVNRKAREDHCCAVFSASLRTAKYILDLEIVGGYVCGFAQDYLGQPLPDEFEWNFPEDVIILPVFSGEPVPDSERQDFMDIIVNALHPALQAWQAAGGEKLPLPFTHVQPDEGVSDSSPDVPF
jgi:hypothetical protein